MVQGGNRRECPFQLGRYRILSPLGSGTQGDVYLAEREGALGFRRKLAVKIVEPVQDLSRERAVKSLANEARGLAEVFHPNVVQVFDFSKVDDRYLLVMEYVDGINVSRILRAVARPGGAIHPPEALAIAEQVARGLACVHGLTDRQGEPAPMVHRDLKPSNVIVSRHGIVKLVDFGLVKGKQIAFHTMVPNITRGTPSYMSPEQVRGEPLTPASDQFSLAALLYEMLSGEPMFRDDSEQAVMFRVVEGRPSGDPTRLRETCPEAIPLLARCLAMDPAGRFGDTEDLADALRDLRLQQGREADLRALLDRVEGRVAPDGGPVSEARNEAASSSAAGAPRGQVHDLRQGAPGAPPPAPSKGDPFRPPPAPRRPPAPSTPPEAPSPPALGKATEQFFYGDRQERAAGAEGGGAPADGASGGRADERGAGLGAQTQAFFFGEQQRRLLDDDGPARIGPAPGDEIVPRTESEQLRQVHGGEGTPPGGRPSSPPAPPPSPPGASPRLGAQTQAFFFGPGERETLGAAGPPAQLGPREQADDPGPADPGQGREERGGGLRDLMSKDVSFRVARPIRRQPERRPADGEDEDSTREEADGERPPWERDG